MSMLKRIVVVAGVLSMCGMLAQTPVARPRPKFDTFEVATIKPVDPEEKSGRYIKMEGPHRFVGKAYTVQLLIAAAYELNPRAISGGPAWMTSDHFDILAQTPGEVQPDHDEQMAMLRSLLVERFKLRFHREQKEFPIYALEVAKGGAKLKASTADADALAVMGPGVVSAEHITLPGRNATIVSLASLLQRAILDRPVVDRTGLTGRYDFDLVWTPDETQFGGDGPKVSAESPAPPLFAAIQQQLGLRLEATRGAIAAMVVDGVERATEN
jgi:uncharacterized protein (TIGR03435 family)